MAKYVDIRGLGKSAIVPKKRHEAPMDRHWRRLLANLSFSDELAKWCHAYGIRFTITNDGHHWQFRKAPHKADWWPSSAKLVFGAHYERGVHAHDWQQVVDEIQKRWRL